jgi:hypothetical protein
MTIFINPKLNFIDRVIGGEKMKITNQVKFPILFIMAIAILLYSCSFKPSPKKIVEDYVEVYNSHQVERIMALYTDSVTFEVTGFGMNFNGKDAVQGIAEYDSALNTIMTLSNITMSADTVFCSLSEHNDWVEAAEIPDAYYPRTMFVVEDNKIGRIYAEIADSSLENFERVLDHFVFWGDDKYPENMRQMAPTGEFVYNAENGTMVVEMRREWKAEHKQEQQERVLDKMPVRQDKTKR